MAADFGLDAVASDSGAPDASVPPSPCADLCTRFVGCATGQCGEGAAGQAESLDGLCQTACLESPAFAPVGGGIETWGDFVELARQSLPEALALWSPPHKDADSLASVALSRVLHCRNSSLRTVALLHQ